MIFELGLGNNSAPCGKLNGPLLLGRDASGVGVLSDDIIRQPLDADVGAGVFGVTVGVRQRHDMMDGAGRTEVICYLLW